MKATIYSHKLKIGIADLQLGDVSMGHVYGKFIPDDTYYGDVQHQVWKSLDGDSFWSDLRLNVQLENGCFIYSAGGISIDDVKETPMEPKQIDIVGIDSSFLNDFFKEMPALFVEQPWNELEINQKIAFENELALELGVEEKQSFFNFLKAKVEPHVLFGATFSAVCHDQRNDDVLFRVDKPGLESQFALVHLTWKSKKEYTGYPSTRFYKDFDDFKYQRMRPDRIDWEY